MSGKLTGLVLEHLAVKPGVKLTAAILADHADSDGICWPSYRRLAAFAGCDVRTVRRHVAELIALGVVTKLRTGTIVRLPDGRRQRVTNAYRINGGVLQSMPSLTPSRTVQFSPNDLWIGDTDAHLETDTDDRSRGSRVSTKPSRDSSDNNHHDVESVDNLDVSLGELIEELEAEG